LWPEKLGTMLLQKWPEALFRSAVTGSGVDVVHAILQKQVHCAVGFFLCNPSKCGSAKDDARTGVTGATKRHCVDHCGSFSLYG
jgi:hypothetical protein